MITTDRDAPENSLPLETDIRVIAAAAEPAWADNWNFRSYLMTQVPADVIDQTVFAINAEVAAAIDCTTCGNCCREIFPLMTGEDASRMATGLGETEEEFQTRVKPAEFGAVTFKCQPCPMLKDNKCQAYEFRPRDCREYPHLDKPDFLAGSIGTIENYGTCPIIYNVYNRLKTAFTYDPATDYIGDQDPEKPFA